MDKLEDNPTLENELNEVLKILPNLEHIEIHGSENTMLNIDINSICSDKLRKIDLYRCDLSDANIIEFCNKNKELDHIECISCNIVDANFIYELPEQIKKVDLSNNPLKIDDVEKLMNFRREKLPNLNLAFVDDVIDWHDERGISLSKFIGTGIKDGLNFELEFTRLPYKKQMTINDIITLEEFIDFSREEFQKIEHEIYIDENQEIDEEYVEKINSLPLNEKFKIALTVEQAEKLKGKLINNCEVQIYCENVAKLPIEELENLEEGLNITSVQIIDDIHKKYNEPCEEPYTIEKYKACREKINELIEDIDLESYAEYPNRDKRIFEIIVKRLANIEYDYSAIYRLREEKKVTSRNLEGGLLNGLCVCAGFAEIAKQVLSCVGIEAEFVAGTEAVNPQIDAGHAWNQVKLDGVWYNFDLTNCRAALHEGRIPEDFFLLSDENFRWNKEYKRIKNKKHECKEDLGLVNTVECLYGSYQAKELLNALRTVPKEMYPYFWDYSFTKMKFIRNIEEMRETAERIRASQEAKSKKVVEKLVQDVSESDISESARTLKATQKELEGQNLENNQNPDI